MAKSAAGEISLDLSELTDMEDDVDGSEDELIILDNGTEKRKLTSEIALSGFNNDSNWTSNTGDITGVTAGTGLTGGGSSGGVTLNVIGGDGITANADEITVDSTVVRTTGSTMTAALKVGTKVYEDFESSGHFYLGNNDWGSLIGDAGNGYSSTHKGMSFNNQSGSIPCLIPIDPEATYRIKIRFKQVTVTTGTGKFYFGVKTLNEDKTHLSSDTATSYNYGVVAGGAHSADTVYTYEDTFSGYNATNEGSHQKFDPEGKYFDLIWIANYQGTGEVVIQSIEVERLPDSLWIGDTKTIDESRNLTNIGTISATGGTSTNWNTAYGWGDHSGQNYLTSLGTALVDGDFSTAGLMTTDGSGTYSITTNNASNWNTAYGWGNHASGGYSDEYKNFDAGNGDHDTHHWNKTHAAYSDNGESPTYIVLTTNVPQDNYSMGGFTLVFQNYYNDSDEGDTVKIYGYWNPESNSGFVGFRYHTSNPECAPTIQVGRNSSGNTVFLISGETSNYAQVIAKDFWTGYSATSASSSWGDSWAFSEASATTGISYLNTLTRVGITATQVSNWNTAYGWGNHGAQSYITNSTASLAGSKITSGTISNARLNTDMQLEAAAPRYKLKETDVTNTPVWWMVADGGDLSFRLNNTGSYPLQFTTNATNNAVTQVEINYPLKLSSVAAQASETSVLTIANGVVGTRDLGSNAFNSTAFTTNTGTVTSVTATANTGLTVTNTTTTPVITLDSTLTSLGAATFTTLNVDILDADKILTRDIRVGPTGQTSGVDNAAKIAGTTLTGTGAALNSNGDFFVGDSASAHMFYDQSEGSLAIKSGTSGARTEIVGGTTTVYDASGNVRVKIGDLS